MILYSSSIETMVEVEFLIVQRVVLLVIEEVEGDNEEGDPLL